MFLKFSSLKSNNRPTPHSWSGKHGRFGHVIKRNVMRSLVEKYAFHLILEPRESFLNKL